MHVLFRESHGLEEGDTPRDLGQDPAPLVVLSFSDSDLTAFAAGWRQGAGGVPPLRLANLAALTHPLSVDTYIDRTLCHAKGVLIRLIGGASWWSYGLDQVTRVAHARGIALAVLPADGHPDPALDMASTVPVSTLRRLSALCDAGGAVAAQSALAQLALAAGFYAAPVVGTKAAAAFGLWHPDHGLCAPDDPVMASDRPRIVIPFYRSWLMAADTAAVAALIRAFDEAGYHAIGAFVPSLKDPAAAAWLRAVLPLLAPVAVVNTTAFSAVSQGSSPLDAAGVPVFQAIHATTSRAAWQGSDRGLTPSDLAMHIALPEVDGRIGVGVVSFKDSPPRDPDLQFSAAFHVPDANRIAAVVARVRAWHALAQMPRAEKRVALVLSTYPGKAHRMAHAVGLDALASAEAMMADLAAAGYETGTADGAGLETTLRGRLSWPVAAYKRGLATLPEALQNALAADYGAPENDPAVVNGDFMFAAVWRGHVLVALQPERSATADRTDSYHDLSQTPCHAYVAFYLWLRARVDALVHIGAHGTLEWLPGKSVALSDSCWPEALVGPLPILYPFIVNDPGEAAQARRRIGAVTLGHLPPPLVAGGMPPALLRLERLLDEYSTADGLDPARRDRLITAIRDEARGAGVEADLNLPAQAAAAEAIPRIDRFVCDLKESQFGDGLHIWGRGTPMAEGTDAASVDAEQRALIAALDGNWIAPGPSGSPWRGRSDVLPTGRHLYGTDPRAVPSRAAHAQGVKLAEEFLRRHLQDHGDYPRGLIVNLWGSATMRTAGEEFAMALHLAGVKPVWDDGSDRVTGYEIVPLALLDRPRIDVTLRVSGLFRDVFPDLARLFDGATTALATRDEMDDMNPYRHALAGPRVFSPAPGRYGLGLSTDLMTDAARRAAGDAWLAASSYGADGLAAGAVLRARLKVADTFVHVQDLPETDVLMAQDYAAHEAGFAAAMAQIGGQSTLYHLDTTRPETPHARPLAEEIARVTRARAANPRWLLAMRRHGFRGAAEIAATLDHLAAFAHLAGVVPPHLFDLYHQVTVQDPSLCAFMAEVNPDALAALHARFDALRDAGLWVPGSNSRVMGIDPPKGAE